MAGRHRGASVGVVARALLARESVETSESAIRNNRGIEFDKAVRQDNTLGRWCHETVCRGKIGVPGPEVVGYVATENSNVHLQLHSGAPLCTHHQQTGIGRLRSPMTTTDPFEAAAWGRPSCIPCFANASVTWSLEELAS